MRRPDIGSVARVGGAFYLVSAAQARPVANESPTGSFDLTFFPALPGDTPTGAAVTFHKLSSVSTGGHVMEYVGSGVTYNALPEYGGVPDRTRETLEVAPGRVYYTTSDHLGNFKVGPLFSVDQATGHVDIATDRFSLTGVTSVSFRSGGRLTGVISNMDSVFGVDAVPTQTAVKDYVDKHAVPGGGKPGQVLFWRNGAAQWDALDKTAVGLGNVANEAQVPASALNQPLGVATLGLDGNIDVNTLARELRLRDVNPAVSLGDAVAKQFAGAAYDADYGVVLAAPSAPAYHDGPSGALLRTIDGKDIDYLPIPAPGDAGAYADIVSCGGASYAVPASGTAVVKAKPAPDASSAGGGAW